MVCKHTFIKVEETVKPRPGVNSFIGGIPGVIVVCLHCGQTRKVFTDGEIVITFEGNKPIDEDEINQTNNTGHSA